LGLRPIGLRLRPAGSLRETANRLGPGLAYLPDALPETADRLAGALPKTADCLAGALPKASDRLARALAGLPQRLADAAHELVEVAHRLAGPLTHVTDGLAGTLADVPDGVAGALTDIAHGLARTLAHLTDSLAGAVTDVRQRRLGALPHVLGRVARLVDGLTRTLADLRDGSTEPLHQLGIAVQARHEPIDDGSDVVEPGLQDQLGLDALDVELDPAEVHVETDVELDQVEHLCLERHMSVEVIELEVNEVDLELRHIEKDVRRSSRVLLLTLDVAPVLAIGVVARAPCLLRRTRSIPASSVCLPVAGGRALAAACRCLRLRRLLSHQVLPRS
jgi:hypothetical protein